MHHPLNPTWLALQYATQEGSRQLRRGRSAHLTSNLRHIVLDSYRVLFYSLYHPHGPFRRGTLRIPD